MTEQLRVLVVEDHPVFVEGIVAILRDAGFDVVGTAADGESAVSMAAETAPDVVLMDLNLPGVDGVEATRRIGSTVPTAGVLVLTMLDGDESVFAAVRSGARGYLLKEADGAAIVAGVRAVARGEAVFGPALARRLAEWFATRATPMPFAHLTEREHEVLALIAAGLRNRDIAERLAVSEKTVRNHVSNVLNKLHVSTRAEAIVKARKAGLAEDSQLNPG